MNLNSKESSFLLSTLVQENCFQTTGEFIRWFDFQKSSSQFLVEQIPFDKLDQWYFEKDTQNLIHVSGKFFKIEGIKVSTNFGSINEWNQPIINQPEIGILGILTRVFDGIRYFLMQAKMEPGNVNTIQLSPTVQATKSNYTKVHKGKLPFYLEYFLDRRKSNFLIDRLQSEQGGRFLRKRNRNMIIEINEEIPIYENFRWLTLGQIKSLLKINNFVNMDTRSVLSCIPFVDKQIKAYLKNSISSRVFDYKIDNFSNDILISMIEDNRAINSLDEIISWFTELKTKYELHVKQIPLKDVSCWKRNDWEIAHDSKHFFTIIALSIQAGTREVFNWTQPLLKSTSCGLIGFITKKINGILHFLIQAKVEPGNMDIIDLAPTVSCSEPEFRLQQLPALPFLDILMNIPEDKIRYSTIQSEEGGRFYHFQNKSLIVELDESTNLDLPENYIWMTFGQIMKFVRYGYFNIEARSLISQVNFEKV
ncbi:MAG: NDP-hexose 2,3-dehydratase family protein [bacterium]|nr:NDP-hexose 2,3-dehydratase family protein [bacterium]